MVIKHQMSKNMPNTDDHASLHHSHSVRFACTLMSLVILRLQGFFIRVYNFNALIARGWGIKSRYHTSKFLFQIKHLLLIYSITKLPCHQIYLRSSKASFCFFISLTSLSSFLLASFTGGTSHLSRSSVVGVHVG